MINLLSQDCTFVGILLPLNIGRIILSSALIIGHMIFFSDSKIEAELKKVINLLLKNGYPEDMISGNIISIRSRGTSGGVMVSKVD